MKLTFYEYLRQLIDACGVGKNRLIGRTGIDRSSFFQFLKGARYPTGKQLLKIGAAAGFTAEERTRLHELYVLERYGMDTLRTWTAIRESIEALDSRMTLPGAKNSSVTEYLRQVLDSGGGSDIRLDLFLPVSIFAETDLAHEITALATEYPGTILMRIIVTDFSDLYAEESRLVEVFMQSIQLFTASRLQVSFYHFQTASRRDRTPLLGFPFFILGGDSVLMLDDRNRDSYLIDRSDLHIKYAKSFEDFLSECELLSMRVSDVLKYADYLYSFLPSSDADLLFTLEYRPCILSIAPVEMITKYAPPYVAEIAVPYTEMLQKDLHMKPYFTLQGLLDFRKDRMVLDSGMNIHLEQADAERLFQMIMPRLGDDMFFLNPGRFRLPEDWHIACGRKALLFTAYRNPTVAVISRSPQLCTAFYTYFSHLDEDFSETTAEQIAAGLR